MHIHRTALVPYRARDMYRLVHDVDAYPEFLSWCDDACVLEESPEMQLARLVVSMAGFRTEFTTRNSLEEGRRLAMQLVEGPFRDLEGVWVFTPLGEEGSKVALQMDFEFGSASLVSRAFRRGFAQIVDRLVKDFCQRAEEVY